jgi:hypothetical protein
MQERRQHPRVPVAIPAHLRYLGSEESAEAFMEDLSLGGCVLQVRLAPRIGSHVEVEFLLEKGRRRILAEARIIHSLRNRRSHRDQHVIGLEFTHLDREDADLLGCIIGAYRDRVTPAIPGGDPGS